MSGEQAPAPEKQACHAVNLLNRLYHGQFELVLKPAAFVDFRDSVFEQVAANLDDRPEYLMVQFYVSETPEEFAKTDDIHWFALRYGIAIRGDDLELEAKAVHVPSETCPDLSAIEDLDGLPIHVLQWGDIDWSAFNPDEPVHPEN